MALFYTDIPIVPQGILTTQTFQTPVNGRTVSFSLPEECDRCVIYLRSGTDYIGPYAVSGPSTVATNVRGLEMLRRSAYRSTAVVIDMREVLLPPISQTFAPIAARLPSGETAAIRISGTITASIVVNDCRMLLRKYDSEGFAAVETYASHLLDTVFHQHASRMLKQRFSGTITEDDISEVEQMAERIRTMALETLEPMLSGWLRLNSCRYTLQLHDTDQLMKKCNYDWEKQESRDSVRFEEEMHTRRAIVDANIAIRQKTAEALLEVYRSEPIPREICQIIEGYVARFQDISPAELVGVCQELRKLSERSSPERVLSIAKRLISPDGGQSGI